MTSRIAEIINSYPPLAFTSHPALIAELEEVVAEAFELLKQSRRFIDEEHSKEAAEFLAAVRGLTSPSQSAIIQGE